MIEKNALRTLAAMALLLFPGTAATTEDDFGAWFIVTMSDRLPARESANASRWRYWLEAQARYPDAGSGVNQLLLRPGIGYDINASLSALAGYARFRTHARAGRTSTEDRFWQHLSWRFLSFDNASLSMRFRFEQRRLSDSNDTGHLFRYQLKYLRKLNPGGAVDIIASIEPFFDLAETDYGARRGLNQARGYLGLGFRLTAESALEIGYQLQHLNVRGGEDRANHLAMLNFRSRF